MRQRNGKEKGELRNSFDRSGRRVDVLEYLPKIIRSEYGNLTILVTGVGETLRLHLKPGWSAMDG